MFWELDGPSGVQKYKGNMENSNISIATDCCICLENIESKNIIMFNCLHTMHQSCLNEMEKIKDNDEIFIKCPLCRKLCAN